MSATPNVSELLKGQKVVPVVVIDNEEQAIGLAKALLDGGISVIEITLRNDFGIKAIKLVKEQFPQMLILAGTVNTSEQMEAVVEAGADGIVSPGITASLLETAKRLKIPYLPGVASATDVLFAIENGLNECKLFPATVVGGIGAIKALGGPFPDIRFCPTGGVSKDNYNDFLELSNVMCVGGTWVAPTSLVQQGKWSEITDLCKAAVG